MLCCCFLASGAARGELKSYYVAHDTRETYPSGDYAGLANPNFRHLTLIEASPGTDHFHSVGNWILSGPPGSPAVVVNPENRVPPVSHSAPPTWLPLLPAAPGSLYEGKLVSTPTADPYTDLNLRAVMSLAGFPAGSLEQIYYASSGGRWSQPFVAGALLGLELVSRSPGLHIGDATQLDVLSDPGDVISLGDANLVDFTPVLWMDGGTPPGKYTAELRLVDLGAGDGYTPYGSSGIFGYHVEVVPEPSTMALGLVGLAAAMSVRPRRRIRMLRVLPARKRPCATTIPSPTKMP